MNRLTDPAEIKTGLDSGPDGPHTSSTALSVRPDRFCTYKQIPDFAFVIDVDELLQKIEISFISSILSYFSVYLSYIVFLLLKRQFDRLVTRSDHF